MEQDKQQDSAVNTKQVGNERDLAGAGGGNIPCKASSYPTRQQQGGSDEEEVGRGVDNDTATAPEQHIEPGTHSTPGATSANDQPQQGALGGRTPGQANHSIGDMDRPREHSSIENTPADPMTSRSPDKLKQMQQEEQKRQDEQSKQQEQENQKENA